MSRRLRSWLIGCGALALVAAGWTFILTDLLHERSHYAAEAAERSRARAMIFARFTDTTFASAAIALRELGRQAEAAAALPLPDQAAIRAILQRTVQTIPFFYGIAFVGADGNVLATSQDNPAPFSLADQAYFGWHRRNPGIDLHVSPPMVSWLDTLWAIPISMRVDDAKGAFAGIIVGLLKPDYFTGFIRDLGVDSALIALPDGTVLVSEPAPLVSNAHRSVLDRQMISEWREQAAMAPGTVAPAAAPPRRRTVDLMLSADSGPQAASYVNLDAIPAAVFARISLDRVMEPWLQSARHRIIGGGLLSILTLLLALLAISGMRRDVKRSMALRAARDEAQLARQRAEEADRNKSVFLAHTSHELRTPLNAIIGFSEVLAREVFGPLDKRYREYSRDIHHSGQHLLTVVNNILDLAKVSADHWELAHERFSLPELLDDIGRFAAPEAELRSVELKRDMPLDFPELYTDRRVVLNLITNGIKFTPAGGVVAVAASRQADGGIIIMVIDTGVGIDPADLDKVVKPFRNISNLLARKEGGTGLGLPLCHAFVDLLGGDMAITSQPGEGTSVMVRLPPSCIAAGSIGEVDATAA